MVRIARVHYYIGKEVAYKKMVLISELRANTK